MTVKTRDFEEPKKEQIEAVSFYGGLMNEALVRIAAIDHGTLGKTGLASPFVQEFSYLQLRKLSELVAVGCLVAHGDIKEAWAMRKEWNADKIIKRLAALNENFFPHLVAFDLAPKQGPKGVIGRAGGMTKEEMLAIYYECDKFLHVGSLKKLVNAKSPIRVSYPDITLKAQKFRTLIESHTVFFDQGKKALLCYPNGPTAVQVAIANRMDDEPPKLGKG